MRSLRHLSIATVAAAMLAIATPRERCRRLVWSARRDVRPRARSARRRSRRHLHARRHDDDLRQLRVDGQAHARDALTSARWFYL